MESSGFFFLLKVFKFLDENVECQTKVLVSQLKVPKLIVFLNLRWKLLNRLGATARTAEFCSGGRQPQRVKDGQT